jgi:hypothetical protein
VSTLSSASVIRHILREMIGLRNELRTVQPIPPESRGGAAARS